MVSWFTQCFPLAFVKYIKDLVPKQYRCFYYLRQIINYINVKLLSLPKKKPSHPKTNTWVRPQGTALCPSLCNTCACTSQQPTETLLLFWKNDLATTQQRHCHASLSLTFVSFVLPTTGIAHLTQQRSYVSYEFSMSPTKVYPVSMAILFHGRTILIAFLLHLPSNLAFSWILPSPICCSLTVQRTLQ